MTTQWSESLRRIWRRVSGARNSGAASTPPNGEPPEPRSPAEHLRDYTHIRVLCAQSYAKRFKN
jgi:hypothetical protein